MYVRFKCCTFLSEEYTCMTDKMGTAVFLTSTHTLSLFGEMHNYWISCDLLITHLICCIT